MKLRALPHSFWKEPNAMNSNDLPICPPPLLPPLFAGQANPNQNAEEDGQLDAPSSFSSSSPSHSPSNKKKWVITSQPSGELFDRLFDHLEKKRIDESLIVRRGRPRKKESKIPPPPHRNQGDDPCIVEALASQLFPDLSLEGRIGRQDLKKQQNVPIIRIGREVEFPAIQVANNYPAILNELVSHL